MRTIPKLLGLLVAVLLALGIIAAGFAQFKRQDDAPSQPQYTVATVVRGDIVRSVRSIGQLIPLNSVEVSTQISGLISEVNVDFNTPVKKGQVLARIDPSTYEQRLRQARADLEAAQAAHALTTVNAQRLKGLYTEEIISHQEYDQIAMQLQQSEASLLTRRAAVENARVDLERCTITAPIDGIVIYKQVEVGKTIVSSLNAPTLFTIAQDLSRMRIIAPVNEVDVWLVQAGQEVTFAVDAFPDRTFRGRVTQIRNPYIPSDRPQQQPIQQSQIASFDTVIEVDNSDLLLRPSLTATVIIAIDRRRDVLQIPNGALRVKLPIGQVAASLRSSDKTNHSAATVYRLPGGSRNVVPEAVTVHLGVTDSFVTEITDGLNEQDRIITGTMSLPEVPRRRPFSLF